MHTTVEQLNAFAAGRLAPVQGRGVLRHLRGCAACREASVPHLAPWMDPDDLEAVEAGASAADKGAEGLLRAASRALLARSAPTTAKRPGGRDEAAVTEVERRLANEGLEVLGRLPRLLLRRPAILALLRRGWALRGPYPRQLLRYAQVADDLLAAVGQGGDDDGGTAWRDLRCRVATELGNAYRANGEHAAAKQALERAMADLHAGSDALLHGRLIDVRASLLADGGHFAAARSGMNGAMQIFRRHGQARQLARVLVADAHHAAMDGDLSRAFRRLDAALRLIDHRRSPVVALAAQHNLCDNLLTSGRTREAMQAMRRLRLSVGATAQGVQKARICWVEGRILDRSGDLPGADRAFAAARKEFEALGAHYLAANVVLDQAAMRQAYGEEAGSRALTFEATYLLLRSEPQREVYAAAMLLRTANRFSDTRGGLPLRQVVDFLVKAQFNPTVELRSFLS